MARGIKHDSVNGFVDLEIVNAGGLTYGDPRRMEINVRDRVSGQLIVSVPMSADQVLAALAGTYHDNLPAWIVPKALRSRIGKKDVHEIVEVTESTASQAVRDYLMRYRTESSITSASTDVDVLVHAWAEDQASNGDWDDWRMTHHNYGWALHLTKWVEVGEDDTDPASS